MEQILEQLNESIHHMFEITSRMDERLHILIEAQKSMISEISSLDIKYNNLESRLLLIESNDIKKTFISISENISEIKVQLKELDSRSFKQESKIQGFVDIAIKIMWTFATCGILYKLGWNNMPLP